MSRTVPATGPRRGREAQEEDPDQQQRVFRDVASHLPVDRFQNAVSDLRTQRSELSAHKRELSKAIKLQERKRQRLLQRSARLSNMQLMEIMAIREKKELTREDRRARMAQDGAGAFTAGPTDAPAGTPPPAIPPSEDDER